MTSDITLNNALQSAQRSANSSAQLAEDFDDFLVLLTTQLQNQDPLSPMESNEFTSQLVSFAGVEQQINANQKLNDLVTLNIGNAFSSTLGYVGKDIKYVSSEAFYDGSTPVEIDYSVSSDAVDTTLNILDSSGSLVFSQKVSDDDGVESFQWDGTTTSGGQVAAGTYSVRIDSLDSQQNAIETSTLIRGRVNGVETQNGQTFLLVGERAVAIANVINVQEPRQTTNTDTTTDATDDSADAA